MSKKQYEKAKTDYFNKKNRTETYPDASTFLIDCESRFLALCNDLVVEIPHWTTTTDYSRKVLELWDEEAFVDFWVSYYLNYLGYELWNGLFTKYRSDGKKDGEAAELAERAVKKFHQDFM